MTDKPDPNLPQDEDTEAYISAIRDLFKELRRSLRLLPRKSCELDDEDED